MLIILTLILTPLRGNGRSISDLFRWPEATVPPDTCRNLRLLSWTNKSSSSPIPHIADCICCNIFRLIFVCSAQRGLGPHWCCKLQLHHCRCCCNGLLLSTKNAAVAVPTPHSYSITPSRRYLHGLFSFSRNFPRCFVIFGGFFIRRWLPGDIFVI